MLFDGFFCLLAVSSIFFVFVLCEDVGIFFC